MLLSTLEEATIPINELDPRPLNRNVRCLSRNGALSLLVLLLLLLLLLQLARLLIVAIRWSSVNETCCTAKSNDVDAVVGKST